MRIETFLHICRTLNVTPNDIPVEDNLSASQDQNDIWELLNKCPAKEKETALRLLTVYLKSIS